MKKVRAALLGTRSVSGAGSANGEKGPKSGLIELPEISVRKDISISWRRKRLRWRRQRRVRMQRERGWRHGGFVAWILRRS